MTANKTLDVIKIKTQLKRDRFTLSLDLAFPACGVTAIFGPSGSGKTSLLRCIAGLEKAPNSHIQIAQSTWQSQSTFMPISERGVGFVFQDAELFPHITVQKNLEFAIKRSAKISPHHSFNEVCEIFNITPLLNAMPNSLSGGQRQRVAIARAILSKPSLLLMDEPLANLDAQAKSEIIDYLDRFHKIANIPIIYVSHAIDEVLSLADRIVLMNEGQVLAVGAVNELLTRTDLPLAHLEQACSIINGTIISHDTHYSLTRIQIGNAEMAIPHLEQNIADVARVRIAAKDVSIALSHHENTSIMNVLPATIMDIKPAKDSAKSLITLAIGCDDSSTNKEILLAQVTQHSVDKLQLQTNQGVYAQIKSVALMR